MERDQKGKKKGRNLSWKNGRRDARSLVEALHRRADWEGLERYPYLEKDVNARWEENNIRLNNTTLRALVDLTEKCGQRIESENMRNAILCLIQLDILEDTRAKTNSKTQTGSSDWFFVLKLPSTEKRENLNWLFGQNGQFGQWDLKKKEWDSQRKLSEAEKQENYSTRSETHQQNYETFKNEYFEELLTLWRSDKEVIYSAPSSAFLVGEHAVIFGHLAIYYPLPLRLYVHIDPDYQTNKILFNEYKVPNPKNINQIINVEHISDYGSCNVPQHRKAIDSLFLSVIYPFLLKKSGFKINILSSFPLAVGLNSSGAFSVCLAQALVDNYLNIESFKSHFDIADADDNKIVLILAWVIENCFHANSSSGAGIHASFYGRKGRHPLIYCTSRRSYLHHRILMGWHPVNVGEEREAIVNLSKIKTFIFDPAEPGNNLTGYPSPPPYNITILYSGIHSKTGDVLAYPETFRRFVSGSSERVKYIHQKFEATFPDLNFQHSLENHTSEILSKIYLNDELTNKDDQLSYAYKELMMEAVGNVGIGILNSVLSDWKFVPELMNSCQSLLSTVGVSHPKIDCFASQLQTNAFQYHLKKSESLIEIGSKLTGAGKGGDIIVLSLYESELHQKFIEKICTQDNVIHFDSCKLSSDEWNNPVKGVVKEI